VRQQNGIVATDERGGHPDPQLAMSACHIIDQIAQALWNRGFGVSLKETLQPFSGAAGIHRMADGLLADPVDHRRTRGFHGGHRRQLVGQVTVQRAGHHDGQIRLDQEIVDRGGQGRGHRRQGGVLATVQQSPAGTAQRIAAGQPHRMSFIQ
jgi:hypothetical protein